MTTAFFLVRFQAALPRNASCLTVTHEETRFAGSCLPLNFPWLLYRLLPLVLRWRLMAAGPAWRAVSTFSSQPVPLQWHPLGPWLPSWLAAVARVAQAGSACEAEGAKIQGVALAVGVTSVSFNSSVSPLLLEESEQMHHCWRQCDSARFTGGTTLPRRRNCSAHNQSY